MHKKPLLIILVPIMVLILAVSGINYRVDANRIRENYQKAIEEEALRITTRADMIFTGVQNLALQLALMPELNSLLTNPFQASIDKLKTVKENLTNFVLSNQLFHSMYVYFKLNDKVMSTGQGIYDQKEFFDNGIIEQAMMNQSDYFWYGPRPVKAPYDVGGGELVVTMITPIPITSNHKLGYLIINIPERVLYREVAESVSNSSTEVYIINQDGIIVSCSDKSAVNQSASIQSLPPEHDLDQGAMVTFERSKRTYSAVGLKSRNSQWLMLAVSSAAAMQASMSDLNHHYLAVCLLLSLAGFIISIVVSKILYRPLTKLGQKISNEYNAAKLTDSHDVISYVNKSFDAILQDNIQTRNALEEFKPIVRDRMILDLLNGKCVDECESRMDIIRAGINISGSYYTVVYIEVNYPEKSDAATQFIESHPDKYLVRLFQEFYARSYTVYDSITGDGELVLILNYPVSMNEIERNKLQQISLNASNRVRDEMKLPNSIYLSEECANLATIYKLFQQVKWLSNYRAFVAGNIRFIEGKSRNVLDYPWQIQQQMIEALHKCDIGMLKEAIERLFAHHQDAYNVTYIRMREVLVVLMSTMATNLLSAGITRNLSDGLRFFDGIDRCQSLTELKDFVVSYYGGLLDNYCMASQRVNSNLYYLKTIQYIHENYHRDISAQDIADSVGVSAPYLSRVFKTNAESTLIEYLTKYRIEQSYALLIDERLTINEVGLQVGYNNVHSFIRSFKKTTSMTPGEYRSIQRMRNSRV